MSCLIACAIGSGFISSKLIMMSNNDKIKLHNEFVETLDKKQLEVYSEIITERLQIYIQGMFLGLLLAFSYLFFSKNFKLGDTCDICMFVTIAGSVSYSYYKLAPKSKYMLNYLSRQDQVNAWLDIYKSYAYKSAFGFVLGIIGYFLVAYGLKKSKLL
jgi:hypothetical protein